jgi:hypothetical protein
VKHAISVREAIRIDVNENATGQCEINEVAAPIIENRTQHGLDAFDL